MQLTSFHPKSTTRYISRCVVVSVVSLFSVVTWAEQNGPSPEPRQDIPIDKCLIELSLPVGAKVTVGNRDYGEQRSIALPLSEATCGGGLGGPWFALVVDFPNGGRLSTCVEAQGGAVVHATLTAPPIETVLLKGPSEAITSLAFSPDGNWIAMGTDDHQAILWETSTGRVRWNGDVPWSNASSSAVSVAFSPDGSQVLVGSQCSGVALLDTATGRRLRDLAGEACKDGTVGANGVAFSPTGKQVAAVLSFQDEPVAAIWDLDSGTRLHTLRGPKGDVVGRSYDFLSITFTPDGKSVVYGSDADRAVLFDVATGSMLREFPSATGPVLSVAVSPDGSKLLAGTEETNAVLFDLATGNLVRTYVCSTDDYVYPISSVAFSPDGRQVLASADERTLLFDVESGAQLRSFTCGNNGTYAAAFSPDGQHVLSSVTRDWGSDWEAVLWEVASGKQVRVFRGPTDAVRSLKISPDGQCLTVRYSRGSLTKWDLNTGQPIDRTIDSQVDEAATETDDDLDQCVSPDGRWIVSRNTKGATVFTDTLTTQATTAPEFSMPSRIRAAFSPNSPRIFIANEDAVHVFNPQTGKQIASLISAYNGQDWLVTTPEGYCAGSPGGRSLIRWRVGEAEYPMEQLENRLHRPDLVAKMLQEVAQE